MLSGENGLITKAQEAKDKTIESAEKENQTLQEYENLMNEYIQGSTEDDTVGLSSKSVLWIGDYIMQGGYSYKSEKGMVEYYNESTGTSNSKEYSTDIFTIGNNLKTDEDGEKLFSLMDGIEQNILGSMNEEQREEIDFIVLEGGIGDFIQYTKLGTMSREDAKEIGTADNTTNDTVINDFRKAIEKLNTNFPNAKILFVKPLETDQIGLEQFYFYYGVTIRWEEDKYRLKTIEELNQELKDIGIVDANYTTYEEIREATFTIYPENLEEVNWGTQELQKLFSELQKVCQELGVEYIDFGENILQKRIENKDENEYLAKDCIALSDAGYKELISIIIDKLEPMMD